MINNIIYSLLLLLIFSITEKPLSDRYEYTNYYYYENERYELNPVKDKMFFEFERNFSRPEIFSLLGNRNFLFDLSDFDEKESRQILKLRASLELSTLRSLINELILTDGIVYASPVFRMPDGEGNPNTLIGVEKEIIAQFKQQVSESDVSSYLSGRGMTIVSKYSLSAGRTYLISLPEGAYSMDYANELFLSGLVNYSEPNLFFTNLLQQTIMPNDPHYPMQWSHRNLGNNIPQGITGVPGCDMKTDSAWAITLGSPSVIVSIVDTGIDTLHEDLHERMIVGLSINTFSNLPNAWDDHNHGTAVAGIVTATGNNNLGVSGVAPLSRIFGVKIFNSTGGTGSNAIINGLIAAWQRGSWVSSNSWGGGPPIAAADNAILDGVTLGRNGKGVIWSFASGNSDEPSISWPSSNPNVISVGGISPCNERKSKFSCDDEIWWGANYGTGLDIVSPCVKIYTTDRTGVFGYTPGNYIQNFGGTSSATPNASGVFALMLAVDSTLTADTVRARIARTADKVGSYTYDQPGHLGIGGWNNEMGYGKINAYRVIKETYTMGVGSPLVPFNLQTPEPDVTITSFPMSNIPVTITWDTSGMNATFKWIFGTILPARILTLNTGTTNNLTPTLGQLDNILDGLGVNPGGSINGQWDVWAYRVPTTTGPDSLKSVNGPRNITLTRGIPALSPFNLNAPQNNTTISTSTFNDSIVNISWTRSGEGTAYRWKFGAPTISTPLLDLPSLNNGYDSTLTFVNYELDAVLDGLGLNPGDSMIGQWAVWAYNGFDSAKSTQTWNVTLKRQDKNEILILYDSSSVNGRASRDTVIKALNELDITYDLFNRGIEFSFNSMTMRGYKKVMLLGSGLNVMNNALKDSLIAYLNSGGVTFGSKSRLIILSESIGERFGHIESPYYDPAFLNQVLGLSFVSSRPLSGFYQGLIGYTINNNYADSTNGMWPGVIKIHTVAGSERQDVLYLYRRHINNPDSAAGIGMFNTNYNVATLSSDARNLLRAADSPSGSAARRIINGLINYVDQIILSTDPAAGEIIPEFFELSQNYPNPFNPVTIINFQLPMDNYVTLKVFDITGREVMTLVNEVRAAGSWTITFNAANLSSGVYFYRLEAGSFVEAKRMTLIK